jgi:hypothetical protein
MTVFLCVLCLLRVLCEKHSIATTGIAVAKTKGEQIHTTRLSWRLSNRLFFP